MFMSEYNHTLDAKGRVIMPAKFREVLGDTFIVTKGFDRCLYVYSKEDWAAFQEQVMSKLDDTVKEARQFARFLFSGASEVEVDKQGRIPLFPALRKYAELDKDVVLAGVGRRIEIWDRAKWDGESLDENIDDILSMMNKLGISFTQ